MNENEEFEFRYRYEQEKAARSGPPVADKTELQREVLAEMPWLQRQAVATGGELASAWEGLKSLIPGVTADKDIVKAARVASGEAPVGAFVGQAAKYAPAILAPAAIPAQMAAAGTIGAATASENRIQEGILNAAGAGLAGMAVKGVRHLAGSGSLDRAREALRQIIGRGDQQKAILLARGAVNQGRPVTTAQALSELDNPTLASLEQAVKGTGRAAESAESAAYYNALEEAQKSAREATLAGLARGATSEESEAARRLMKQRLEGALGPKREAILQEANLTGELDISPVINRIEETLNSPRLGASKNVERVLSDVYAHIDEWVTRGGGIIDANAAYTIRKEAVNEAVGKLLAGADPIASKRLSAKLSNELKPVIDDAIEAVSPGWKKYVSKYAKGLEAIDRVELMNVARDLHRTNKKAFIDLIKGESPEVVNKVMSGKTSITDSFSSSTVRKLEQIAGEARRDIRLGELATDTAGKRALAEIISDQSLTSKLPKLLNRYAVIANTAIEAGEMKVNKNMLRELDKAMHDPQAFLKLMDDLPLKQRGQMTAAILDAGERAGVTIGTAATLGTLESQ